MLSDCSKSPGGRFAGTSAGIRTGKDTQYIESWTLGTIWPGFFTGGYQYRGFPLGHEPTGRRPVRF